MYLRKNSPERDVTKYLQNFAENATAVVEAERMDTNFRKFRDLLSTERSPNRSARYLSNTLENRSIKSTPRILPSNLTKASTEMVDEILTRKGLTQKLAQKKSIDRLYKGIVKLERSDSIVGYPHKLDISDIKEFNDQTNHLKYFLNIKHELTGIFETVRGKNSLKLMTKYEMVQFLKAKLKETKENYKGMLMSVLDITKIAAEIIKMIFYLGADEEAQILELLWRCLIYQLDLGMSRHLSAIDKQETMHKIKLEEIENKWKTDIENSRKISNKHIHNLEQEIRRLNTEIKQLNRWRIKEETDKEKLLYKEDEIKPESKHIEISIKESSDISTQIDDLYVDYQTSVKNIKHPLIKLSADFLVTLEFDSLDFCEKVFNKYTRNGSYLDSVLNNIISESGTRTSVVEIAGNIHRTLKAQDSLKAKFYWKLLRFDLNLAPHTEDAICQIKDLIRPIDDSNQEIGLKETLILLQSLWTSDSAMGTQILSQLTINYKTNISHGHEWCATSENFENKLRLDDHLKLDSLLIRLALCVSSSKKPLSFYFDEISQVQSDDFIKILVNSFKFWATNLELETLRNFLGNQLYLAKIIEKLNIDLFYKIALNSTILKYDLLYTILNHFEFIFSKASESLVQILTISSLSELIAILHHFKVDLTETEIRKIYIDILLGCDINSIIYSHNFFPDAPVTLESSKRLKRHKKTSLRSPIKN